MRLRAGAWFLLVLLFGAAAGGLAFSPHLRVRTIVARGGSDTLRAQATSAARSFVDRHAVFAGHPRLFLVSRPELAQHLTTEIPELAAVLVARRIPGILDLELQEKVPVAILDHAGQRYTLDGRGTVIAQAASAMPDAQLLPRIRDLYSTSPVKPGEQVLEAALMDFFHRAVVQLPEHLGVSVHELLIPAIGTQEVHVQTSGGWMLLLDGTRTLDEQLRTFESVVSDQLGPEELARLAQVDLRIRGKVFYRLHPPPETPRQTPAQ